MIRGGMIVCLLFAGCQSQLVNSGSEHSRPPQGPALTPPGTSAAPRDQVPHIPATAVLGQPQNSSSVSARHYQVGNGETWESIARQFGVAVDRLLDENGREGSSSPIVGDWIVIPSAVTNR
ncbi:MAG: LysM domain-containing protein [Planctomycetota bacterium]|nr:LysM domain-containing protein [Planctomycetota bacterium]MDA1213572.1 LysM domain-containing protein [Planctomycetota bacterium]